VHVDWPLLARLVQADHFEFAEFAQNVLANFVDRAANKEKSTSDLIT
jgi:hypothetical protein